MSNETFSVIFKHRVPVQWMTIYLICLDDVLIFGVKISFVFIPRTVRNMGWWWGLVPHHCWIFRWILEWKCEAGLPVPCSSSSRVALTQIWRHGVSCVAPRLRCSSTNLLRSTSVPRQVPNHSVAFQLFSVKSAFSIMKKFVGVRIFFKKSSILLGENEDWWLDKLIIYQVIFRSIRGNFMENG